MQNSFEIIISKLFKLSFAKDQRGVLFVLRGALPFIFMGKKQERILPFSVLERLLQQAGAERVSKGALRELAVQLEQIAKRVGSLAVKIAMHAKRKTVQGSDVLLASELT